MGYNFVQLFKSRLLQDIRSSEVQAETSSTELNGSIFNNDLVCYLLD